MHIYVCDGGYLYIKGKATMLQVTNNWDSRDTKRWMRVWTKNTNLKQIGYRADDSYRHILAT